MVLLLMFLINTHNNNKKTLPMAEQPNNKQPVTIGNSPHYVYIIEARDGFLYCGMTKDFVKRFKEHNSQKCVSTMGRGRYIIRFIHRTKNIREARLLEMTIKNYGVLKYLSAAKYRGMKVSDILN